MEDHTDFIATELLKELKEGNERKDARIAQQQKDMVRIIFGFLIVIFAIVASFLLYLNQYDFSSTSTITTTMTSEGVYSLVDSEGNIIASDLTPEDIERIVTANGEGYQKSNQDYNQYEDQE